MFICRTLESLTQNVEDKKEEVTNNLVYTKMHARHNFFPVAF